MGEFEHWLDQNHGDHSGFWMRLFKNGSGHPTITYAEALDVALCYGWIDGQKQRGDSASWLQRFTKRRARSPWSKINIDHVARLRREGRMRPAGVAAAEAAKADGRWDVAYGSSSRFEMPAEFTAALAHCPKAASHYATLNQANRYAIFYRLTTPKRPETRARRLKELVAKLARGEKLHG